MIEKPRQEVKPVTVQDLAIDSHTVSIWSKHRFVLLIVGSIAIALTLVAISLLLYSWSGAAQLDLSRPGYEDVQKQEERVKSFAGFPQTGAIDKEALDEFRKLFDDQRDRTRGIATFEPEALSDESLGIRTGVDTPEAAESQQ